MLEAVVLLAMLVGVYRVAFGRPMLPRGRHITGQTEDFVWFAVGIAAAQVADMLQMGQVSVVLAVLLAASLRVFPVSTEVAVGLLALAASWPAIVKQFSEETAPFVAVATMLFAVPVVVGPWVAIGSALVSPAKTGVWRRIGALALAVWALVQTLLLIVDGQVLGTIEEKTGGYLLLLLLAVAVGFLATWWPELLAPLLAVGVSVGQLAYAAVLRPETLVVDIVLTPLFLVAAWLGAARATKAPIGDEAAVR